MLSFRNSLGFNIREEVGVVADLSELHQEVQVVFFLVFGGITILKEILVYFELEISKPNMD